MNEWEEDLDVIVDTPQCTCCGSEIMTFLGTLGQLQWFRCRACGAEQHQESNENA